jgi:predicted aspartyl protease
VKFIIRNPLYPERSLQLEGLVDTGAHFTQVPKGLLEQIDIRPFGTRRVQYADGTITSKPVASAEILIETEATDRRPLWRFCRSRSPWNLHSGRSEFRR